jgi:hypothetical protein
MEYSTLRSLKPIASAKREIAGRVGVIVAALFVCHWLPIHAATILFDSGDPPQGPGPSLFSDQWVAQPLTATGGWEMTMVGAFAAGTDPITLKLATDASGLPGLVLGTWTINETDWDPGGSWGYTPAMFLFTQGVTYWFEYTSSADLFSGDFLPAPASNGIPDIALSFDQGQSWSIASGAGPLGLRIETDVLSTVPEPRTVEYLAFGLLLLIIHRRCSTTGPTRY